MSNQGKIHFNFKSHFEILTSPTSYESDKLLLGLQGDVVPGVVGLLDGGQSGGYEWGSGEPLEPL